MNKGTRQSIAFLFFGLLFAGGMMPVPIGPVLAIIGFIFGVLLMTHGSDNDERERQVYIPRALQQVRPRRRDEDTELREWP